MEESYERAIATWITRKNKLDESRPITLIEFEGLDGCDTCGFGAGAAIQYFYDGIAGHVELDSPGLLLQELTKILAEQGVMP